MWGECETCTTCMEWPTHVSLSDERGTPSATRIPLHKTHSLLFNKEHLNIYFLLAIDHSLWTSVYVNWIQSFVNRVFSKQHPLKMKQVFRVGTRGISPWKSRYKFAPCGCQIANYNFIVHGRLWTRNATYSKIDHLVARKI